MHMSRTMVHPKADNSFSHSFSFETSFQNYPKEGRTAVKDKKKKGHKDVYGNALSDFDVWEFESPVVKSKRFTHTAGSSHAIDGMLSPVIEAASRSMGDLRTESGRDYQYTKKSKGGKEKKQRTSKAKEKRQPNAKPNTSGVIEGSNEERTPQLAPLLPAKTVLPLRGLRRSYSEDLKNFSVSYGDDVDPKERLASLVKQLRMDQLFLNEQTGIKAPSNPATASPSSPKTSSVAELRSEESKVAHAGIRRRASRTLSLPSRKEVRELRRVRKKIIQESLYDYLSDSNDQISQCYEPSTHTSRSDPMPFGGPKVKSHRTPRRMRKSQVRPSRPGIGLEKHLHSKRFSTRGLNEHLHHSTGIPSSNLFFEDGEHRSIVSAPPEIIRDRKLSDKCRKFKLTF